MRKRIAALLVSVLCLALAGTASAATGMQTPSSPQLPITGGQLLGKVPVAPATPVAFNVIANRYTEIDPATTFDFNGDMTGDMVIAGGLVTGKNGAKVQLLDPPVLTLDEIQAVPAEGYADTAPLQTMRVYLMKLASGYAKFMFLQTSPKVTVWFHYGTPTTSTLTADGTSGHAVLTWGALPDAALGYNVYRYEIIEQNAYTVTLLNDFVVKGLTFTDNTGLRRNYLYVVMAIKADGSYGKATTVAPCQIQSITKSLVISLTNGTAKVNGVTATLEAPPVIKNGRLMVPASLLTSAGVVVTPEAGKVTLTRRVDSVTYTVVMNFDLPDYTWNGTSYKAEVPPYKAGSVIMVPLRVVAPALGFGVTFNSADMTATVQWYE